MTCRFFVLTVAFAAMTYAAPIEFGSAPASENLFEPAALDNSPIVESVTQFYEPAAGPLMLYIDAGPDNNGGPDGPPGEIPEPSTAALLAAGLTIVWRHCRK
jgi:hypothetical protein